MATFQFAHPEKFDFTQPEKWEKWFQRFERFLSASELNDKDEVIQINTLIYCMGAEADEIFASFNLSAGDRKKFAKVRDKFNGYFIPKRNVIFERAKFNLRKQEVNETVDTYVTALYVLAEHCKFGALHDELIRDRIVVGLRDSKLSEKLQLDADLTLEKAITQARQSEAVKQQQSIVRQADMPATVEAVKGKKRQPNSQKSAINQRYQRQPQQYQSKSCTRCGKYPSHQKQNCPAREAKCNKCAKKGHYAKMCRSKVPNNVGSIEETTNGQGFLGTVRNNNKECKPWNINLKIRGTTIQFKVDTGADVSVIPENLYKKLSVGQLKKSDKALFGPGSEKLCVLGKFESELESNEKFVVQDIYVVRGLHQALLGRPAIKLLNLISGMKLNAINIGGSNVNKSTTENVKKSQSYQDRYPKVFNGLGKTKWEYKIRLREGAQPYALMTPRKVPLPLMNKVKEELERMENLGVTSKVDEPSEWCAGMVVVPKSNGKVRICVDLTKLNESVKRENHPIPSVEETLGKLAGAKVFSKIDANYGFYQINLAPESRPLTTFITPFGRYCFQRLPFGISSGSEIYQKRMAEMLEGLPGVVCHIDDILIFGKSQEEHDANLEKVFAKIEAVGLTLNEKCEFSKNSVKFIGHIIDSEGIRVDPEKVRAIKEMPVPENVSDVRRFLGMVNQLGRFSPNIAEKTKPLRELLKNTSIWNWGDMQDKAFNSLKQDLMSMSLLAHYDPNKETKVTSDSSSYGLGSVLSQKHGDNWKPVAYASRALTETESRYAQIEKEALAITWSCEKFSHYLIGLIFHLESDHKPLIPLFSTKDLIDLPPRIQRFRMRLMRYKYTISHVPGKNLYTADTLSRAPSQSTDSKNELQLETNVYVDFVMDNLPASETKLEQIKFAQDRDNVCIKIKQYCKEGWPEKSSLDNEMQIYWSFRGDFTIQREILMKGCTLVIPQEMQFEF